MNISKIQTYGSVLLLLATLLALPASALAQTAASFRGTLRDQSGAAVPGAPVVLMNERTGEQRTGTTTADGMYVVTNLKPSLDTIRVILDSFAPLEYTWLELAAGQEFHLDLELRPAGVTETVTVQGEATTIHLSSARIGADVSQREVQDLPINGRQMSQLYLKAPGTVNSGRGIFGDIGFSGGPCSRTRSATTVSKPPRSSTPLQAT